jgi:hypothetical protein
VLCIHWHNFFGVRMCTSSVESSSPEFFFILAQEN